MKTAKLVVGILTLVFSVLVLFQSCAAGLGDAIQNEGGTSGGTGMLVGFLMIAGGIVDIAARRAKGGAIACTVLFGLAAILGLTSTGIFADLKIWGGWCLILCIVNVISLFTQFKTSAAPKSEPASEEK